MELDRTSSESDDYSVIRRFVQEIRMGPYRLGWEDMPKELRRIVAWSPLVLLFPLLFAFPAGTYTVNGQEVTRQEFLSVAAPALAIIIGALAVLVYGLWTERWWVRELSVIYILMGASYDAWLSEFDLPVLTWLALVISIGADLWFWYGKRDVAAYYRRLSAFHIASRHAT